MYLMKGQIQLITILKDIYLEILFDTIDNLLKA